MKTFQLLCNLIIPATMILAGLIGVLTPPAKSMKDVGGISGYRSKRSMRTVDTWNFANYNAGISYLFAGFYMIFATGVLCVILSRFSSAVIHGATVVIVLIQIVIFIMPMISVEKKLERYFDSSGKPLNPEKIFRRRIFGKNDEASKPNEDKWEDWNRDEWRDSWREEWDDWDLWEKRHKRSTSVNVIEDAAMDDNTGNPFQLKKGYNGSAEAEAEAEAETVAGAEVETKTKTEAKVEK